MANIQRQNKRKTGGETAVGETTDSSSSKTLTSLPGTDAICGLSVFYVLIHIAE